MPVLQLARKSNGSSELLSPAGAPATDSNTTDSLPPNGSASGYSTNCHLVPGQRLPGRKLPSQAPARRRWRHYAASLLAGAVVTLSAGWVSAQEEDELENRPSANRILPEETVLYLRVRSFPDFLETMETSSMGQMLGDDRVAPLVNDLYENVKQEYDKNAKDQLDGLELEQFKDFFAGEFCFAMVAKRRKDIEGIMICDVNPESETANRLLGVAKARLEEDGETVETETEGDIEIQVLPGDDRNLHYFRIENTVYLSTNRDLCAEMIANLQGEPLEKTRPFIENRKYRTIMGHCRVDKDHPPILTFFVDPIDLFKAATRGNAGAQIAVGMLPVLGLDGLSAIGGATLPGDKKFQALSHIHLLMASPRKGILEAVSFKQGSYEISPVIPNDVAVMMTTRLDLPRLYNGIKTINDTMRGEGTLESDIENASEEIGLQIKEDLIDAFTGNFTLVTWPNPESNQFNGTTNGYLLGLHDPEKATETMEKLLDRIREENEDAIKEDSHNGVDYYYIDGIQEQMARQRERRQERWADLDRDERERRERRAELTDGFARAPVPAFAIFEEHLVIADSIEFMEKFIETYKGKNAALRDAEDYQDIREIAEKYLDGQAPSGIMFSRPMAQLGPIWRAIKSDDAKKFLEMSAENEDNEASGFTNRLLKSMEKNKLPELDELQQYFTTSGGFMTDDATGLHFFLFETRATGDKPKSKKR